MNRLLFASSRLPINAALIILAFIPIALLLGWVSGIVEILIIAVVQLVVFFIIWLIMYLKQLKSK